MKKLFVIVITVVLSVILTTAVFAATPGTVAGSYYYTDIVTYLSNTPINSINIGGVTLIDAESMSHYGFTVKWHGNERWLEITDNHNRDISPQAADGSLLDMKSGTPGTVAGRYYHTDIETTLNGKQIISFNIGGRTFIGAEAMRDFGYSVIWDGTARTLVIDSLSAPWSFEYPIDDASVNTLNYGFILEFINTTKEDGVEFYLSEALGEFGALGRISFDNTGVRFIIYQRVTEYGEFWKFMHTNIRYGEREHEDTPERRAELSSVFRVLVNNKEIGGEISYTQGSGWSGYYFIFDNWLDLESVETIRVEMGYK